MATSEQIETTDPDPILMSWLQPRAIYYYPSYTICEACTTTTPCQVTYKSRLMKEHNKEIQQQIVQESMELKCPVPYVGKGDPDPAAVQAFREENARALAQTFARLNLKPPK